MASLTLSGGSYGANWLPLILPLAVLVIIAKGAALTIRLVKKWRARHKTSENMATSDF